MKYIIFYRRSTDVDTYLAQHKPSDYAVVRIPDQEILHKFNRGLIETLFLPAPLVTGWRTPFTEDECQVMFIGEGWLKNEIAQGEARVKYKGGLL